MPSVVTKIELPADSLLRDRKKPGDFLDCYAVSGDRNAPGAARVIADFPEWVKALVALRNLIILPFGLKSEGPETAEKIGPFPVEHMSDREVIAGFNDRHLDFRISVLSRDGRISLATWVRPHNFGGRAYLRSIMPFHIAIARNALMRVAKAEQTGHKTPLPE